MTLVGADILHSLGEWAVSAATLLVIFWTFRRQDRNEREEIRKTTAQKRDEQHKENQDSIAALIHEQTERPNHVHTDWSPGKTGPLLIENIRFKPKKNGS